MNVTVSILHNKNYQYVEDLHNSLKQCFPKDPPGVSKSCKGKRSMPNARQANRY